MGLIITEYKYVRGGIVYIRAEAVDINVRRVWINSIFFDETV